MTSEAGADSRRPRGGQPDKRRAILAGALAVFARDGFTRGSIDAISAEAEVSTRTIYNHFGCKADLFQAVIQESAGSVAEAQIAIIDRHLRKIIDLESDLIDFGRELASPMPAYADHFALVRQINAEAGHVPQPVIDAWQEAGPLRVRRELGRRLQEVAARGLLDLDDPERAALHLMLLVAMPNPSYRGASLTDDEISTMVMAGVRTFLYGNAPLTRRWPE